MVVAITIHPNIIITIGGINLIVKTPSIIPNATAKETTTPVNQPIKPRNFVKKLFFAIF